jgi:hypothetical protein
MQFEQTANQSSATMSHARGGSRGPEEVEDSDDMGFLAVTYSFAGRSSNYFGPNVRSNPRTK